MTGDGKTLGMLGRLFGHKPKELAPIDYDTAKQRVQDPDPDVRRAVARRDDLRPELLYYLVEDQAPAVRREVAANVATPGQADLLLAHDLDDEVRLDLARKIGRLLPGLAPGEATRVREMALETLEVLANDQLPKVRAALSEELRDAIAVPRAVLLRLAHDVETIVAVPVLEYSPLLGDDDLLEIIAGSRVSEVLSAIARRRGVTPIVADALVTTLDVSAVAALLANPSAQIREETLDAIIEHAETIESWHEPLVMRADLSVRAIRRISQFVAASLLHILSERHNLPDDLADELRRGVRKRLETMPVSDDADAAAARVAELKSADALNDDALAEAIERHDRAFVLLALAELAQLPVPVVRKIIDAKSARAITALSWKAGLAMRTAMRLQLRIAMIQPQAVLNARRGIDYPLSAEELQWQIDYFSQ